MDPLCKKKIQTPGEVSWASLGVCLGPLGGQSGSEKSICGPTGRLSVDRIWLRASFGQFWASFGQATAILDEATAILDEVTAILDDGCGRSGYRSLSL